MPTHERPLRGDEVEKQLPLCCAEHRQPRSYTRQAEAGREENLLGRKGREALGEVAWGGI